ncbi:2-hydroxyacid dehydrogenase [Betaproteobacteria bacterium PRO7]|jgi:lactate dehydrogenase-like 2-hydroxyacid dehydrogenase|nr:2-hydroxyacid dehydrogenase [Betaproteobacteria bacterium PRO7]
MKPALLLVAPIYAPTQARLESDYRVARWYDAPDRAALLAQAAPEVRVAVTSGGAGMKAELIGKLPRLELIACFGVGVDAIDLAAARARGIRVTNTPDVLTDDVADLALGLVLATVRRIVAADRYVREGRWLKGPMALTGRIKGTRLGIVGMGRIGQAIAQRAAAFGMDIAYHGPRAKPVPWRYEPDLLALARESGVLVVACPGGESTRRLIDRAVLDALGPAGILINIARGSVVDEDALVAALASGRLGGAGLDVFADEPRVPAALLALDNVVLQPHQGSATHATRGAMGQLVLDNVEAFFAGRPLPTPVT